MDTKTKTVSLIFLVVIVLIAFGFIYYQTLPKKKAKSEVIVVSSEILDESSVDTLVSRSSYGTFPVTVSRGEAGRKDPFASY